MTESHDRLCVLADSLAGAIRWRFCDYEQLLKKQLQILAAPLSGMQTLRDDALPFARATQLTTDHVWNGAELGGHPLRSSHDDRFLESVRIFLRFLARAAESAHLRPPLTLAWNLHCSPHDK